MEKLKLGQPVHYYPQDAGGPRLGAGPFFAIVAKVHEDGTVNLAVFDDEGCVAGKHKVKHCCPDDDTPTDGGYCCCCGEEPTDKHEPTEEELEELTAPEKDDGEEIEG